MCCLRGGAASVLDVLRGFDILGAMPRTMRVEYPGAICHVLERGDRQADNFVDDVDRQVLLKTLAEACRKTDGKVQADGLFKHNELDGNEVGGSKTISPPD